MDWIGLALIAVAMAFVIVVVLAAGDDPLGLDADSDWLDDWD